MPGHRLPLCGLGLRCYSEFFGTSPNSYHYNTLYILFFSELCLTAVLTADKQAASRHEFTWPITIREGHILNYPANRAIHPSGLRLFKGYLVFMVTEYALLADYRSIKGHQLLHFGMAEHS